ncbi:unnamed protein product [Dovyalis caffra]|uniref:F-box domain-containing protein n=1 Tax=Dovyalis caffra TaxID=77055 RepID=A0AAV1QXE9_9ROSI|nr:unnamed protein product [Dovyalis caffra]
MATRYLLDWWVCLQFQDGNYCCSNKAVHSSTSDRISDLPSNVIENILMCLPIRDAVRITILSKTWRHRWADVPQVVFDDTFLRNSREVIEGSTTHELLMKTVYEVLLLHFGPIHKFVLSISGLKSCPEIDRLILFLSTKGIQDFTLDFSSEYPAYHKLPSYLFTCLQLRYLKLCSCIFKPPPSFNGFSKLISIQFQGVHFDAEFLKDFISNCPLLERLKLHSCVEISCLEINAPNLKLLHYISAYKCICFKNAPLLAELSIYESSFGEPDSDKRKLFNLIEVFSCLPAIEYLSVDYYFLKDLAVPDSSMRLQTTLNHLKFLKMLELSYAEVEEVSPALCLIRSSPNLQKLEIRMYCRHNDGRNPFLQLSEWDGFLDFSLNQLQEVKLQGFHGTRPELEFVKLLLAKSSALKSDAY